MNNILLNISDLNNENAIIALVGIVIVFSALTILYLFFKVIPLIIEWQAKFRLKRKKTNQEPNKVTTKISVGVDAAISAALYLYLNEMHDEENAIMTIKKIAKSYSPWSSKLYSMRWPLR